MDYDIFEDYRKNPPKKDKYEGLPPEERVELIKQEYFKKEAKKNREEEERKQALIKAKKDKKYKEYSSKVELLFKWMIGFALFAVISAGYWFNKDYFFLTLQGGISITGPTKELGKAIVEFILSIMLSFLAPALLTFFIIDTPKNKKEE